MASSLDDSMNCKGCMKTMRSPILLCQNDHSICRNCSKSSKKCPLCHSNITKRRNSQLEELIAQLKNVTITVSCKFKDRGCKYQLKPDEKTSHEAECKSRLYECEGKIFRKWQCSWTGGYVDILKHFKAEHEVHCLLEFKNELTMNVNTSSNFSDIQIIDFNEGQQLFWYKHKTDVAKKKAYWLFQYVGLKRQAAQYYYEFEIHNGVRKIKITEICESDCVDAETIFSSGRCVALPFKIIRSYLNDDQQLPIRFRIMKIRKESSSSSH